MGAQAGHGLGSWDAMGQNGTMVMNDEIPFGYLT